MLSCYSENIQYFGKFWIQNQVYHQRTGKHISRPCKIKKKKDGLSVVSEAGNLV